jgi:gentisate 1,2-dioxygenase
MSGQNGDIAYSGKHDATEELLERAETLHTKPLWAQMNRLNPPAPNPKCQPHVWQYEQIRPSLLQAGELISEKQAERRVLMLVNPSRGLKPAARTLSRNRLKCVQKHRIPLIPSMPGFS